MAVVYSVMFAVSAAISAAIAVAAWNRRPAPGALGLAVLCAAQTGWSATFAIQWGFTDHTASLAWFALRLVWLQVTPAAILIFVLDFTGKNRWLRKRLIALLAIEPLIMLGLILTDPLHGLYLGGVSPTIMVIGGGPVYFVNMAYSYSLILISAGLLVLRLIRPHPYRFQTAVILVAVMLPVVHFLAQVMGFVLLPEVNSVPFTFTITGLLKWYAITRLGLFKVIPVARHQLIEQLPEGIIVFDALRHIADINPAGLRMTGATTSCIGKTADEAFPQQADTIARLREGLLSGEDPTSARGMLVPTGVMEATATIVSGREGQRLATLVTLRDVTSQVAAAQELESRSEQLAAALERSDSILTAMTDGVLLADGRTRLLRANLAATTILGTGAEQIAGVEISEIVPSLPARKLAFAAASTGRPVVESVVLPNQRSLTVEVIPLLRAGEQGAHTLFILRDETDRLTAERMQRDFVANVAHELQTPLTGLSLLAGTIPRALREDPEAAVGFVARLSMEIDRLVRMTRELLALSRVDRENHAEKTPEADFSRIAAAQVAEMRIQTDAKGQTLSSSIALGVAASCDEHALRTILDNLLENAVRYTAPGGHIDVQLAREQHGGECRAILIVTDDGEGIPADDLAHIFERFYRVDKARSVTTGGVGLGLSIVHAAVTRHGGTISVVSEPGHGSTFTVTLPAAG